MDELNSKLISSQSSFFCPPVFRPWPKRPDATSPRAPIAASFIIVLNSPQLFPLVRENGNSLETLHRRQLQQRRVRKVPPACRDENHPPAIEPAIRAQSSAVKNR